MLMEVLEVITNNGKEVPSTLDAASIYDVRSRDGNNCCHFWTLCRRNKTVMKRILVLVGDGKM